MSSPDLIALAHELVDFTRSNIPQAQVMDIQLGTYDGDTIVLDAPLTPNVNDKGCAFGGSLVSVMTLAGWSLVELALRRRQFDCDVFVAESTVRYLAPVWNDFASEASLAPESNWETFFGTLQARGRARVEVIARVPGDTGPAATMTARFVAKRR
ncbi:YiiD C-terminal domain-containing protein [Dyella sp.]|uniref:YiiD C-terminal domain-containing protein n=1 Tax=Dyella sp. TaxID=1869338 RepID=UPI002ED51115